ncbi:hypothetical protein SAMN05216275_13533 [Streptosporangium canum]|uniref:Chitinase n=1 Tax=Streptosporangium canum TaxID=324952 RepID=A0A1I4CCX5_9ACTN|nr:hypothetical protein [Streptosporangium canum]SFK78633.1 hypothetical protein SAMN05216275_13533 [Streptosporangium canum]
MSVATDRSAARRTREPGTPPRSLVALASVALVAGTGLAIWVLPAETGGWARAGQAPHVRVGPPRLATRPAADQAPGPAPPSPAGVRPSGFVTFVDTVRDPLYNLTRAARRSNVRWFTLGHLTAGQHDCTPGWGGGQEQDGNPVADRLGRLRAAGGDAGLAFGGPVGRELAAACTDLGRLTAAYRRTVGAFGATYIDFEVQDPGDDGAVLRRAGAITALQREAAARGRPLTVSFTLPATGTGLAPGDEAMLRSTRQAGAEITAVNLLTPIRRAPSGRADLRPVASAVRAAHVQVARSLGVPTAWHRIALTPVLAGSGDLTASDARKLVAFTTRNGLAWLSTRGAAPTSDVARLLAAIAR